MVVAVADGRVGQELAYLLRTAAGRGELGSPLVSLLACGHVDDREPAHVRLAPRAFGDRPVGGDHTHRFGLIQPAREHPHAGILGVSRDSVRRVADGGEILRRMRHRALVERDQVTGQRISSFCCCTR